MLQGYFEQGMEEHAVFEFFVRKLPARRNVLLAAGPEQAFTRMNLEASPFGRGGKVLPAEGRPRLC
jgi:nicotinate phosphoribosyltransferase